MKKNVLLLLLIFLPIKVQAVSLSCPSLASANEEITCTITENAYIGLKVNYQFDSIFTYTNFQNNSTWKDYYHSSSGFAVGNVTDSSDLNIKVNLKISANAPTNQEYTVSLTNVTASDTDYQNIALADISTKIKIVSDINTLSSLNISSGSLSPNFDKEITTYKATTYDAKTTITASLTDSTATLEGDIGEVNLNYGVNTFTIKVTSAKGSVKEYNIYITRLIPESITSSKSSDATLKSITLSEGEITLEENVFLYTIIIPNEIKTITVDATPNSSTSTVKIEIPDELVVGDNDIDITVTAEDGTTITYKIIVTRERELSSDTSIKNITVKDYYLDFDSKTYVYDLEIFNEDKLEIEIELNDSSSTYKITGNKKLKDGSTITITVTAEDGTTRDYVINIIKTSDDNSISILNYIKIVPLILFIILILIILIIKKKLHNMKNK